MYGLYQIVYYTIIDILRILKSPFFILLIFILYLQYRKNTQNPYIATISSIVYGMFGGLIATVAFIYLQVYLVPMDFLYILVVTIILALIDTRFVCFAYGGGMVVLSNLIFGFPRVDTNDLMLLVAVLHIIEAILIILNGNHQSQVRYFTKEYETIGGYTFNRIWPLPLVLFVGDIMIKPITIIALLTYGDFTISNYPRKKTIKSGIILLIYGLILLVTCKIMISPYFPPLLAIVGHELIIQINKYKEKTRAPLYDNPKEGLRVLDVMNKSVAKEVGISEGDIILEINDTKIEDPKDLIHIEVTKPSKYKLRFFSTRKGLVNKTYQGKKKTLGMITLPRVP